MTRRATVFARAEVTRIVNEAYVDWHTRADRDALLSFIRLKIVRNRRVAALRVDRTQRADSRADGRRVNHVLVRSMRTSSVLATDEKKAPKALFLVNAV